MSEGGSAQDAAMHASDPGETAHGLQRVHLVDQVVDRLRALIARGALAVGERLPSESRLSKDFGVGRSTIREALKVLAHLGLIETRAGSGSYVSAVERAPSPLPASGQELVELFEFRFALESEIAQLAAERRSTAQLAEILHALDELHAASAQDDPSAVTSVDLRFHRSVAAACGNRHLVAVYEQYQSSFEHGMAHLIGMQASSLIGDVHDDLAQAIAAKDIRGAASAVRRTFDEIRMRLRLANRP